MANSKRFKLSLGDGDYYISVDMTEAKPNLLHLVLSEVEKESGKSLKRSNWFLTKDQFLKFADFIQKSADDVRGTNKELE